MIWLYVSLQFWPKLIASNFFVGQQTFIIDYEESGTVAAPTVERIECVMLSAHMCITSYHNHSIRLNVTPVLTLKGFPWFLESGGGELLSWRRKAEEQTTERFPPPSVSFYPFLHPPPVISPSPHPCTHQHKRLTSDTPLRGSFSELSSKKHT